MSYTRERDEFISRATAEGLSLETCRKLLRYATTLQRLQEAQCNGDWPYNGDRDRPAINEWAGDLVRIKWDKRYTTCPRCEASGVAVSAMRYRSTVGEEGFERAGRVPKICPDCRTQELVEALFSTEYGITMPEVKAIFQGDPRGAVLRLATPHYPWSDDGSKGRGLYVPARPGRVYA